MQRSIGVHGYGVQVPLIYQQVVITMMIKGIPRQISQGFIGSLTYQMNVLRSPHLPHQSVPPISKLLPSQKVAFYFHRPNRLLNLQKLYRRSNPLRTLLL